MVETRFQTSFIPKRPQVGGIAYRGERGGMGLFSIIATVLLIVVGLVALGVFLYGTFLKKSIADKDVELTAVYDALDKNIINTFLTLGKKTQSAQNLLSKHVAVSRVLGFFESITLKNVRFSGFTFEVVPGGNGKISLKGEAQSYAAVASQAHVFATHSDVHAVAFSGLALNDKGTVTFTSVVELKPAAFLYESTLNNLTLTSFAE